MSIIKLLFGMLVLCLIFGSLVSIIIFAVDVIRWHDKERHTVIKPSRRNKSVDTEIQAMMNEIKDYTESEVSNVGDDAGKYNSSAFLGTGL